MRAGRDPAARRQRLYQRLSDRAPLARRQALRDRRRHQRDPTHADRAGTVREVGLAQECDATGWSTRNPGISARTGIVFAPADRLSKVLSEQLRSLGLIRWRRWLLGP